MNDSEYAIQAVGIGKRYHIGRSAQRTHLRDAIASAAMRPFRRLRADSGAADAAALDGGELWALRDVTFDVRQGESLGFVGRNGAGKSTLLKVLSRITNPTEGHATIHGRIGSLLEVGAGFQSELTGRENVFLNGAILGMRKREITRKFDEIVAFSEIERFIDMPVKHYSSGMYMRLAFAVAAHLEPEILLVDEALSVGDASFQRKCLAKMGEVAAEGRTVLFVSHHMGAVERLCNRVIWLEQGRIVEQGDPAGVIADYVQQSYQPAEERTWPDPATAPGDERVRLRAARVRPLDGAPGDPITVRTPFVLEVEYENLRPGARLSVTLNLYNEQGIPVCVARPLTEAEWLGRPYPGGRFRDACSVPGDLLNDGRHFAELQITEDVETVILQQPELLIFDIVDDYELRSAWQGKWPGIVRPLLEWHTEWLGDALEAETATPERAMSRH